MQQFSLDRISEVIEELQRSSETSASAARRAIIIALVSIIISTVFGVLDFFGANSWQKSQLDSLHTQISLLEFALHEQKQANKSLLALSESVQIQNEGLEELLKALKAQKIKESQASQSPQSVLK